ncbi:MAG: transglycosylase SLT domain-containing protein [Desulfopila sp.]|jgi:soluble lytic murein transglycosylase-like protein|nr:transglycosylase SLT domain-containing protein [Desulfopila sp.]
MGFARLTLFVALLLAAGHFNAMAAMYKCVGANGKVKFTDTLESEACRPMVFRESDSAYMGQGSSSAGDLMARRSAQYDRIIRYYGVRYDIDPHLIRAVIRTESAFDARAVSKKGAQGLMQLMPETAKELRVGDPFDPEANINGGTRYLRYLLNTFKQDLRLALAAYNAGPTLVKKKQAIPQIPETVQYVDRVLKYYRDYKNGRV